MSASGIDVDASSQSFCGACLPVAADLTTPAALLDFLRANAPRCAGVRPGSTLAVSVTAYSAPMCSTPSRIFCSQSPTAPLPDGTEDAEISFTLTCNRACNGLCMPTTCAALGKNCGPVSDGCGGNLECGMCNPPLKCGFGGVPNVCGR
jgi:hypothetical protein